MLASIYFVRDYPKIYGDLYQSGVGLVWYSTELLYGHPVCIDVPVYLILCFTLESKERVERRGAAGVLASCWWLVEKIMVVDVAGLVEIEGVEGNQRQWR